MCHVSMQGGSSYWHWLRRLPAYAVAFAWLSGCGQIDPALEGASFQRQEQASADDDWCPGDGSEDHGRPHPIHLRFAAYGTPRPFTGVLNLFASEVWERTHGAVEICVSHEGIQDDNLDLIKTGVFDGGIWNGRNIFDRTPLNGVTSLSGLTDNGELAAQANLHLSRMTVVQDELAGEDVIYIAPVVIPLAGYMGRCEVLSVEDLVGLPLRTFGGNTPLFTVLRADAKAIPQGQVWPSMNLPEDDENFVCGGVTSWPASQPAMVFNPWLEAGKEFLLYATRQMGTGASSYPIIMNRAKWYALPGWIRSVMREVSEDMPAAHYALTTANDETIEQQFLDENVSISDFSSADLAQVREAAVEVQRAEWLCRHFPSGERVTAARVLQTTKAFIAEIETIWAVEALLEAGVLRVPSARLLLLLLETALESGENTTFALHMLESFLDALDFLIAHDTLTEADAQPLIDGALAAIDALESIAEVASSCDD